MKTRAELELLIIALDKRLASLAVDMNWNQRREIYLTEADSILNKAERTDS